MSWVKSQAFASETAATLNFVESAHEAGFKVLISAEGDRRDPIGNISDYLTFIQALALANTEAIEIWNEPNYRAEWGGSAKDYATLYRQAYTAIKQINSDTLVIVGAAMPTQTDNAAVIAEWIWANSVRNLPGCVGVHFEDWPFTSLDSRLSQVQTLYGDKSLCFTEVGVLSSEGFSDLPNPFFWAHSTTRQLQALTLRSIVTRLQPLSRLVIVFNVGFQSYTSDPQAGYSIIDHAGICLFCKG